MNNKLPVTAVVLVKDEEANIEDCLRSINWVNEIIVLDDESTDSTPEMCRKHTSTVIRRKMENEGEQRNFGYNLAKNKWVLSIDADERVSPVLLAQVKDFFSKPDQMQKYTALSIPVKTFIGSHWIKYGGWYPGNKIRLFKKGCFHYEEKGVHPRGFFTGDAYYVTGDLIHYGYNNFAHFFASMNRQTTLEAEKMLQSGKKFSYFTILRKMIDRFIKAYFIKGGINGGFLGFVTSMFNSYYQFQSYLKYWELLKKDGKL